MKLGADRTKLILDNFFEFSFDKEDGYLPDKELFDSLSSEEQYFLVSIYNWDDGIEVLDWVVESDKCDLGTAIQIFWLAEPDYYFEFSETTIDEYEKGVWELLQKILRKVRGGEFENKKFEFIPVEEGYHVEYENQLEIWRLPSILKEGTRGVKPGILD